MLKQVMLLSTGDVERSETPLKKNNAKRCFRIKGSGCTGRISDIVPVKSVYDSRIINNTKYKYM